MIGFRKMTRAGLHGARKPGNPLLLWRFRSDSTSLADGEEIREGGRRVFIDRAMRDLSVKRRRRRKIVSPLAGKFNRFENTRNRRPCAPNSEMKKEIEERSGGKGED